MKRLFALIIAVFVFSGCRNQGSVCDPFFGRTAVPPPGTGSAVGRPANPYFREAPQSTAPLQAVPQAPPGASAPLSPADSSQSRTPSRSSTATATGTPKSINDTAGKLAGRERVIRILQPRSKAAESFPPGGVHSSATPTPGEPRRLNVPKPAVDIMDLPEAGAANSPRRSQAASGAGGFRLVSGADSSPSADEPSDPADGAADATEFAAQSSYAHDPGYGWLRGKLEYSQIDRCWKLRYIPVDGNTDKFGGSVVLTDAKMLAGCERGDFVEVRGQVGPRDPKKGACAPTYQATEIKRLSKSTP